MIDPDSVRVSLHSNYNGRVMRYRLTTADRLTIGLIAAAVASAALGGEWVTMPETSAVTMYTTKQGVMFSGVFEDFSAAIDFDPADPEAGTIEGTVRTASVETHDDQNNTYVRGYLDVETHPEAHFESTSIRTTAEGFRADGRLTLKGETNPASLDFSFDASAPSGHAKLRGTMVVNRLDYGIADDVDTSFAGRDVTVLIELDLER